MPGNTEALLRYWTTGEGGTVKIRWGTDDDFKRCVHHLREKVPPEVDVEGLCRNLHKRATGREPGDH